MGIWGQVEEAGVSGMWPVSPQAMLFVRSSLVYDDREAVSWSEASRRLCVFYVSVCVSGLWGKALPYLLLLLLGLLPDKKQRKKGRVHFDLGYMEYSLLGVGGGCTAGVEGNWPHCIHNQESSSDDGWCSVGFLQFPFS